MIFRGAGGFRGFRAQTFYTADPAPAGGDPAPAPADPPTETGDDGDDGDDGDPAKSQADKVRRSMARQVSSERRKREAAEARLREIEEERAAKDEEERKRRGEFEQLYNEAQARLKQLEEENATFTTREQERIDRLVASNEERLKALPEKYHSYPPYSDPEQQATALALYEREVAEQRPGRPGAFGEPARPPSNALPPTDDERLEELRRRTADVQLGRVQNNARGVTR